MPVIRMTGIWNLLFGIYEYHTSRTNKETLYNGETTAASAERDFAGYK